MIHVMREIVQSDSTILRMQAKPIPPQEIGSSPIQNLIAEMKTLLDKEDLGVALAAPQVGEARTLFIVSGKIFQERNKDGTWIGKKPEDLVFINPEIVRMSRGKKDMHEGCLSIRGKWGLVPRAEKTSVRAYNEKGEMFTHNATGLLAHIFQHEIDHLVGILYTDKARLVYDDKDSHIYETRS